MTTKEANLKQLMDQIQEKRKFIEIDNQEYDPITKTGIPGLTIAKNQAKEDLVVLEKTYEKRVGEVCARLFCVGGQPEALKEMKAIAEQQAIVVNADTLFEMIADKCMPYTSTPCRFTVTAGMVMREELMKAYLRYCPDTREYPTIDGNLFDSRLGEEPVAARAALVKIIRIAASTASKPLAVTYAQEMAIRKAVELKVDEEPLAVVVLGLVADDVRDFEKGFFPGRPSEVINVDSVKNFEAALKAAGKKLDKKMGAA